LPSAGQPLRQRAEKCRIAQDGAGLAKLVESSAEKRQSSIVHVAPHQQHSLETAALGLPDRHRKLCRMVEQHRRVAFCCREVAHPERYRARRTGQRVTQRNCVIACPRTLNRPLDGARGLVRKSVKPENHRKDNFSRDPLVPHKADHVRAVQRVDITAQHALNVAPGIGLISHVKPDRGKHSIGNQPSGRVGPSCGETAEPFSKGQRSPVLPAAHSLRPQPPKGPQLIFGIFKTVCERESAYPGRAGLTRRTPCMKQRQAKCRLELHLAARILVRSGGDVGERFFDAPAAFVEQGQLTP
jgi:hypothetical protein